MDPTLSPQILAVLKILEQRGSQLPSVLADSGPASFADRFPTVNTPHEIQYGMSQRPYDKQMVNSLFDPMVPKVPQRAGSEMEPPKLDPQQFPGMEDFLSPGMDMGGNEMEDMMSMFMGG